MALLHNEMEAAIRAGQPVVDTLLARFDFAEGEQRLWLGAGRLLIDGEIWEGAGAWGSVSAINGMGDATAAPVTFTLSGIDPDIYALALAGGGTIRGRRVTLYLQCLLADTMQPLDSKVVRWIGTMDRLTAREDAGTRTVNLICEGLFTSRHLTPAGLWTDSDQQRRSPGDRFFEFKPATTGKSVNWP